MKKYVKASKSTTEKLHEFIEFLLDAGVDEHTMLEFLFDSMTSKEGLELMKKLAEECAIPEEAYEDILR